MNVSWLLNIGSYNTCVQEKGSCVVSGGARALI
jgi:hypothetical protein